MAILISRHEGNFQISHTAVVLLFYPAQANAACADGRARGGVDGPMLVHCDLGLDRSAAFVLLDIMIAKVRRLRPLAKRAANPMPALFSHVC